MPKKQNNDASFVFYRSFYEAIALIPDEAARSKAFTAICEYAFLGVEPAEDTDILVKLIFTQAKPQLDANAKRKADGRTGGRGKKANLTEQIPQVTESETVENPNLYPKTIGTKKENHWFPDEKPNVNVNANVNANENVNENENVNGNAAQSEPAAESVEKPQQTTRFTPPTHQQVRDYIAQNALQVDAERFMDYYTANGWKVGRNRMQSWKAALRNWDRQEAGKNGKTEETHIPQFGLCL